MGSIQLSARNTLDCFKIKKSEDILIISDKNKKNIAQAIYNEALSLNLDPIMVEMQPRTFDGEEPPRAVAHAMLFSDIIIAPTTKSITHTTARRNATKNGARIATMPGITEDVFIRTMELDYNSIKYTTDAITKLFNKAKVATVTSMNGTNITLKLGNKAQSDNGILKDYGSYSNLPAGETSTAPWERSANGVIVADRCGDIITGPTKIMIEDGFIKSIENNVHGIKLKKILEEVNKIDNSKNAFNLGEFGVGTNPFAKITGCTLEDEKVLGTCHFAFGDNTSYEGGTIDSTIHLDVIIKKVTVKLDSKIIIKDGKILI